MKIKSKIIRSDPVEDVIVGQITLIKDKINVLVSAVYDRIRGILEILGTLLGGIHKVFSQFQTRFEWLREWCNKAMLNFTTKIQRIYDEY